MGRITHRSSFFLSFFFFLRHLCEQCFLNIIVDLTNIKCVPVTFLVTEYINLKRFIFFRTDSN